MSTWKPKYLIVIVLFLGLLLLFTGMRAYHIRDSASSAATRKDLFLNLTLKYNILLDQLSYYGQLYINTNDEEHRTTFFLLKDEFEKKDKVFIGYQTFTEVQYERRGWSDLPEDRYSLSAQSDSLHFSEKEELLHSRFLDTYNQLITQWTEGVSEKDITHFSSLPAIQRYNQQAEEWQSLSSSYVSRLNETEDILLLKSKIYEGLFLLFLVLFMIFLSIAFYCLIRKSTYHSYFRQLYNTVVENTDVGISIMSSDLHFEYINPTYREILCIGEENVVGKSLQDVFDQHILETIHEIIGEKRRSGEVDVTIGAEKKHFSYSYFVVLDGHGNRKYITLLNDSTHTHALQKQLKKQLKEIEFYSHAKDSLVANISHELKTPINAISGILHFLKSSRLSPHQQDLVRKIEISSEVLLNIISDVLDLSKIRNNNLSLYSSDFALMQVITNIEDMFSSQLAAKGLQWVLNLSFDPALCVHLDKTRFIQVLSNLVNNACKFTEQGYVKLSVETVAEDDQEVQLQFCVEDSGIGIAEQDISKLFHEFEQLENHLTKQHKGTGLGLFISKNIIESMNGRMWVRSEKNKGSKFYIYLPIPRALAPVPTNCAGDVINTIPMDGNGGRALVVEDTEINLEVAVKLLNDVNVACDVATDGLIALEICKNKAPDYYKLILIDIHMPNMDGYTASRILKTEMGITAPIVALTASEVTDEQQKEYADIICDFILKPFKVSMFYKTLMPYFVEGKDSLMSEVMLHLTEDVDGEDHDDHEDDDFDEGDPLSGRDQAIKNFGGLDSIYIKHIDKFKRNYVNSTTEILELVNAKEYDEARRLVHSLKGLGGTLGMWGVYNAGSVLEEAILLGEGYDISAELAELEKELMAAIAAI